MTASSRQSAAEAGKAAKDVDELQMPVVAEDDYLMPQSDAAAAAYLDFVPDNDRGISSFLYCVILYYCYGCYVVMILQMAVVLLCSFCSTTFCAKVT